MSISNLSIHFFLQLAFILGICRVVGYLAKKVGQPPVVGEMIAGVMMGPSLFYYLLPDMQSWLFPKASMSVIYTFGQVGLVLYMFLVGVEFDASLIRRRLFSAASVSIAGIVVPFTLGGLLAIFLMKQGSFFAQGISIWEGGLFLGAAMSITAFPMLARIIYERGLMGTSLGTLALAAGAIDDAVAWCLLALVLASFSGDMSIALFAVGGGAVYTLGVLLLARPLLARLGPIARHNKGISGSVLSFVLVFIMLAAWLTDTIGIYAVFGAFVLGMAMPRGIFALDLKRILEPLTTHFLLPLFFIYSGLNTQLGLVNSPLLWAIMLLILLSACLGKGGACMLAARFHGESMRDSIAIGTLMNVRGLMELIILNIGLQEGIITPSLFTMMVIMAIVTTLISSPLFELVYWRKQRPTKIIEPGLVVTE
jgi:Kef-type K+ transport system membrane component KefB